VAGELGSRQLRECISLLKNAAPIQGLSSRNYLSRSAATRTSSRSERRPSKDITSWSLKKTLGSRERLQSGAKPRTFVPIMTRAPRHQGDAPELRYGERGFNVVLWNVVTE
jgi:hypothetical protein